MKISNFFNISFFTRKFVREMVTECLTHCKFSHNPIWFQALAWQAQ